MKHISWVVGVALQVVLLDLLLAAHAVQATVPSEAARSIDIPPGELSTALQTLIRETGVQLLYDFKVVEGLKTGGAVGARTAVEALNQLLQGTALSTRMDASGAILISRIKPTRSSSSSATDPGPAGFAEADGRKESAERTSQDSAVTQLDRRSAGAAAAGSNGLQASGAQAVLQEVIVTAQKREERLQDVPVPVTAISASQLLQQNAVQLQDYYTRVPGLSLTPGNQSVQQLTIRGITTGPQNPTVGVTVDGVPYGSSTALGGGGVVPDIDPSDLARIEVLRGPQGTLYGASSMGGLLNFVTVDPSTAEVSGRVQVGSEYIHNGAGLGYSLRGSVNVPLGNEWAVRASGFAREIPGYVDNPVLGREGVNEQHARGGRLSAIWKPSDSLSIKVSALYQQIKQAGSSDVVAGAALSDLQQNYIPGVGAYDRKAQAYSAVLNARIGASQLTSITGYNVNSYSDGIDYSSVFGGPGGITQAGIPPLVPGYGVTGAPVYEHSHTDKFSQELRLSIPLTSSIDWLLGGFYTHEASPYTQNLYAADAGTGNLLATLITFDEPSALQEYAGFTDVTFRFTDQLDLQIGGRESHFQERFSETDTGVLVPVFDAVASPRVIPAARTTNNAFTYLLTPRFKFNTDLMVYVRLASGYRAGGPNQEPGGPIPPGYDPDKTQNYEIGFKGDFLEHRLAVDSSVYYIDWKNIQLLLADPQNGFYYFANGGRAKSEGIELSVNLRPIKGLLVSTWMAWNEAQLTQNLPSTSSVFGLAGDRLPFSSRWSGNLAIEQDLPVNERLDIFAAGSVSYVGDRLGTFQPQVAPPEIPDRQNFPAYVRADLRGGIRYDSWEVTAFANNVTDRRAVLQGGLSYFPTTSFVYIQPRTVGLSISRAF